MDLQRVMRRSFPFSVLGATLLSLGSLSVHAISDGLLDTFTDGTTSQWSGGDVGPPTVISAGGPEGESDAFLQIFTDGFHLGTRNSAQWSGNFLAVGVDTIEMDLNHLQPGDDSVQIRLVIFGSGGTFATVARTPPLAGDQWQHVVFSLRPEDLIQVLTNEPGNVGSTLSSVERLLIRNDYEIPERPGEHPAHITATLGIDNIRAFSRSFPVPRPFIDRTFIVSRSGLDTVFLFRVLNLRPGRLYRLERSQNLGHWEQSVSFLSSGTVAELSDSIAVEPESLFYRVRVAYEPPPCTP